MADIPFTTFAFAGAGGTNRTTPQRINDMVNVLEFGADNTGNPTNNNAVAITNAIATQGLIYFPAGTYILNSSVSLPYIASSTSGEGYHCFGYGAFMHGNFGDWLFRRTPPNIFDNNQIKGFHGFGMQNDHPAGGCLYWGNATNNVVEDCSFSCDGIGVSAWFGNGPIAAIRSHFVCVSGTVPQNSVGMIMSAIGGVVQNCDFTFLDYGVVCSGSNCAIVGNRFEVDGNGIVPGGFPSIQIILSTSGTPGVSPTLLHMSNTLQFITGDTVNISRYSGNSPPFHINGSYTVTRIDATTLSIPLAYVSESIGTDALIYVSAPHGTMLQPVGGGAGHTIMSNSFEGCTIGVNGHFGWNGTVSNCNFLVDKQAQLPAPQARCAIFIGDSQQAQVMQGNAIAGLGTLGGIYYGGGAAGPFNSVFNANNFGPNPPTSQGIGTGLVNGAQTNVSSLLLYEMPRWLQFPVPIPAGQPNAGSTTLTLLAFKNNTATVQANTVISYSGSGTTANLSHAIIGTVADGDGLVVKDINGNAVGLVSLL